MPQDHSVTSVLVPHQIAERCYLNEALYWAAFRRFPLISTVDGEDVRVADDYIEGEKGALVMDDCISPEECGLAGLSVDPEWDARENGDGGFSSDYYREFLSRIADEDIRAEYQRQLEEAEAFERRKAEWSAALEAYLDPFMARLFLALRQGDIPATGKRLPVATVAEFQSSDEELRDVEWTEIPKTFWVSKKIDWNGGCAEGAGLAYALILIETAVLFRAFPIPESGPAARVRLVGDSYILLNEEGLSVSPQQTHRGRPSFAWDEFHVEMARRAQEGVLPTKQEAAIADMGEWCRRQWGKPVGRSTLLGKIKPYYDVLVRKSE